MGCTFPSCQPFHWGTSTAAGPHLQNIRWAKISIFMAHFRIFSAEEVLTLKRSQVLSRGWKHSSCAVTTSGLHAFIYKHCSSTHSRVQSFSWANLSTGHEQFKRGSVTGSEVRAHRWRAALDQLMSAGLPWSCGTAIWAGTDCSSTWNTGRDTSRSSGILNRDNRDQNQVCKKSELRRDQGGHKLKPRSVTQSCKDFSTQLPRISNLVLFCNYSCLH